MAQKILFEIRFFLQKLARKGCKWRIYRAPADMAVGDGCYVWAFFGDDMKDYFIAFSQNLPQKMSEFDE